MIATAIFCLVALYCYDVVLGTILHRRRERREREHLEIRRRDEERARQYLEERDAKWAIGQLVKIAEDAKLHLVSRMRFEEAAELRDRLRDVKESTRCLLDELDAALKEEPKP